MRPRLILGSSSPRRRDLLSTLGLKFEVIKPETDEIMRPGEEPEAYVRRNAEEKAAWVALQLGEAPPSLIISADTVVVLGQDVLEKPRDPGHAAVMLRRLSGRTHQVISGVTLQAAGQAAPRRVTFAVKTEVAIKPLNDGEIAAYIKTGEPLDKAGGYAAQGIGSYMVASIRGSYTNVVGLPVAEVVEQLASVFSYPLWESQCP